MIRGMERSSKQTKQSGVVLVISLIILLVLTFLSVNTARTTLLQEKMTFAMNDSNLALRAAELAIIDAENFLDGIGGTAIFVSAGTNGLYSTDNAPTDLTVSSSWSSSGTAEAVTKPDASAIAARYFIEHLGSSADGSAAGSLNVTNYGQSSGGGSPNIFRITARGVGKSSNSQRILITHYVVLI